MLRIQDLEAIYTQVEKRLEQEKGFNGANEIAALLQKVEDELMIRRNLLFNEVKDDKNWKMPSKAKICITKNEADEYVDALKWFTGGAETEEMEGHGPIHTAWKVTSRGYYFYIGA